MKAQEAIERVYYAHRIWPKENPQPKPPFEQMMSKDAIESKVTDYLKTCDALNLWWGRTLTEDDLQAEVQRMKANSRAPEMLEELFGALGYDEVVIRECLAGPALAWRLLEGLYVRDPRIHGALLEEAKNLRQELTPENFREKAGDHYRHEVFVLGDDPGLYGNSPCDVTVLLPDAFAQLLRELPAAGAIGPIEETDGAFVIRRVASSSAKTCEVESAVFEKKPLDEWLAEGASVMPAGHWDGRTSAMRGAAETAPGPMATDAWSSTALSGSPSLRYLHTAVWTGAEMIVWGGYDGVTPRLNTGGRYNPATDSWTATKTTGAPSARNSHSAVWTGSVMIVWGGSDGTNYLNTGGRYSPAGDSWSSTSTSSAPAGRQVHTAVWTGALMIVWGGSGDAGSLGDGGRYSLTGDSWTPTSSSGAPQKRYNHRAVWTQTQMIVWGGNDGATLLNTGGRYTPGPDTWAATNAGATAPEARYGHTAVWNETEMIVWGGKSTVLLNSGGRYNPTGDSWTTLPTGGAPSAREWHTAVWSGTEMIVWGGYSGVYEYTGGHYNPSGDSWAALPTSGAPSARDFHAAVWADTELIVWGGSTADSVYTNTGGCYMPDCSVSLPAAPAAPTFSSVACTSQTVNWTAVAYAKSYDVWRAAGASCAGAAKITSSPVTGTSYPDTGLTGGSPYSYYITANNACGTSANGACATSTTTYPPGTPTAPSFTAVACTSQTVNWTAASYATSYDVWRATGTSCAGAAKITATPTTSLFYNDTGLTPGMSYSYYVTANNACGTSSNGPCATSAVGPATPAAPAAPSFTHTTTTTVTVNWTAVSGATSYDVWRASVPTCAGAQKITTAGPIFGFSFTDWGRTAGVTYYYNVTANGTCGASPHSVCAGVTMQSGSTSTPGEVSPGSTTGTAMTWAADKTQMSWQSTQYATGYRLYRGTPANLPNLLNTATDSCTRYDSTGLSCPLNGLNDVPASGSFLWFLVTAYHNTTEGTAGWPTVGPARIVNSTGTCP